MRRKRRRLHQPSNCSGAVSAFQLFWPGLYQPVGNTKKTKKKENTTTKKTNEETNTKTAISASNCSGAVSACHLFWPGLYQTAGNKKHDDYEDEEEVEEVEEERDEHEDEYEDERVKTMATIMTTMAIVFSAARPRSVPIRMIFTPSQYHATDSTAVSALGGCISRSWSDSGG